MDLTFGTGFMRGLCPASVARSLVLAVALCGCTDSDLVGKLGLVPPQLRVGGTSSCVVRSDGSAFCWGRLLGPVDGQVVQVVKPDGAPAALRSLDPGVWRICGTVASRKIVCNPYAVASAAYSRDLSTSYDCREHNCVDELPLRAPTDLTSSTGGSYHSCGLDQQGQAYCWGGNWMGQLGLGWTSADSTGGGGEKVGAPTLVNGQLRFQSLSTGELHTCGVTGEGEAFCWGYGQHGEVGDSMIMRYCSGELPYPTEPCSTPEPHRVPGDVRFTSVDAGQRLSCGVSVDGEVYCWGSNYRCELGRCDGEDSPVPIRIRLPAKALQVDAGYWFACAVTEDHRGYCWGHNTSGQLGSLATYEECFLGGRCSPFPVEVGGGHRWREIEAGEMHACGITLHWEVLCWGHAGDGRLGEDSGETICTNESATWRDEPCAFEPTHVRGLPRLHEARFRQWRRWWGVVSRSIQGLLMAGRPLESA